MMSDDVSSLDLPSRIPKCARCRNHGVLVPVRGHSRHCGWKLCSCDKCALLTGKHRAMASYRRSRKAPNNQDNTPEEAAPGSPGPATVSSLRASECVSSLVSYEREPTRMYLGIPPLYHYSAFPMGFSPPAFGSTTPSPPGMPVTSIRPYLPTAWRMEQDEGGAGFGGQGYYPSFTPLMPGLYYMPHHVPMSPMRAEPSRNMLVSRSEDNQSHGMERSETSNKEPHF